MKTATTHLDDEPGLHENVLEWLDKVAPPSWSTTRQSFPSPPAASTSGPWQQVFYCEFDGGRPKRVVIKAMGE